LIQIINIVVKNYNLFLLCYSVVFFLV